MNSGKGVSHHSWIYNKTTGKIIDPYFWEYDMIKQFRNCVGNRIYKKVGGDRKRKIWEDANFKHNIQVLTRLYNTNKAQFYLVKKEQYHYRNCQFNVCLDYAENSNDDLVLCVGAMGWRREDGSIFWEFE